MVALGGSAGSFDGLKELLSLFPADTGLAFIVVVHLSPQHESVLPEILARRSALRVEHARHGQPIEANRVYVIPPGRSLSVADGRLQLAELRSKTGVRTAIDTLFASLADAGGRVAAVLLSGADTDGTAGLGRLKSRGGLTLVQDPVEAAVGAMPRAAIAAGCAQAVLRVADMPARILAHFGRPTQLRSPPSGDVAAVQRAPVSLEEEAIVRDALACVRERTGHDFSWYRHGTVLRHLARRMQLACEDELQDYLERLRSDARESRALGRDLLVSVTSFFRDPESFAALAEHVAALFAGKTRGEFVRAWVPACATGEEAYSVAMLLLEHARTLQAPPGVQVFACDLDAAAIETARSGHYPEKIATQVSEERLARFFTRGPCGYQVRHELRQVVLFTVHDVVKDPVFARMDLVSCRNLLIYLEPQAQQRMIEAFHFALREGGLLFLGATEMIDADSPYFAPLDRTHRLYRQRTVPRLARFAGTDALMSALAAEHQARGPLAGDAWARLSAVPSARGSAGLEADNRELQGINEELRAATEELEINRQELQSINEELHAVNLELSSNLDQLARANTDLHNLMNATAIPTVFLDAELRIMRFTPAAVGLFRLIGSDVGRPLAHLRNELDYPRLLDDARRVLASSNSIEGEVRDTSGRCFLARLLPYRTPGDHIAGVVLSFVDITEGKRAAEVLRKSEKRMRWQKEALVAAVNGAALGDSLARLARVVTDETAGEVRTAFYIANPEGTRLRPIPGAADMPESYVRQVGAFVMGSHALACGLAAPTGTPVLTADVLAEPLWAPWVHLAREFDFRGCWSFPIKTRDSKPVGTFAVYFRVPREAGSADLALVELVTQAAAIIICHCTEVEERARVEAALRARDEELERVRKVAAGYELRSMALQQEIEALRAGRGGRPRYARKREPDGDA